MTNTTALPNPAAPDSPIKQFTNRLGPVSAGAWMCLKRMHGKVGAQIIEDIDYYNRAHQMLDLLTPLHQKRRQTCWLNPLEHML